MEAYRTSAEHAQARGAHLRMERRIAATQATLDAFKNRPLAWGEHDCAHMALHCLRGMGHTVKRAKFGSYKTEAGAMRALKRAGFADLADILDGMGFPRIPPAAALPGDIVGDMREGRMTGLILVIGNGRVLAFTEASATCRLGRPDYAREDVTFVAWRIEPCL